MVIQASAFVKLLIEEDGSDLAATLWDGCDAATSSRLAYVEVHAALAAGHRSGRLSAAGWERAGQLWESYCASTPVVELSAAVGEHAGRLAGVFALRGADAVHLASVLALPADTVLAGWDLRLRRGADAARVAVVPHP